MTRLDRYAVREIAGRSWWLYRYTGFMLLRGLILFSDLVLQSETRASTRCASSPSRSLTSSF